jgi:NADH-quinone oxidoreductase subunit A
MYQDTQISEFGFILLFLVLGVIFVSITLCMSSILRPSNPSEEKLTTYECGEDPRGDSHIQFNMRFYVIGLIFLLFDVELVFLFPWATVFGNKEIISEIPMWGWLSFTEMTIFIFILLLGLMYAWRKGDLDWIKPNPVISSVDVPIPSVMYANINNTHYKVKEFEIDKPKEDIKSIEVTQTIVPAIPRFKPNVLKVAEESKEVLKEDEVIAQPIYKPKFKVPVVEVKLEPIMEIEEKPKEFEAVKPPAYKPRFTVPKKAIEIIEPIIEEQHKDDAIAKHVYKPRFNASVVVKKKDENPNE